jgi:hypothetical protein
LHYSSHMSWRFICFGLFIALIVQIVDLWVTTPCWLVSRYRPLIQACCPSLQPWKWKTFLWNVSILVQNLTVSLLHIHFHKCFIGALSILFPVIWHLHYIYNMLSCVVPSHEESEFLPPHFSNLLLFKVQSSDPYTHDHDKENESGANVETFFKCSGLIQKILIYFLTLGGGFVTNFFLCRMGQNKHEKRTSSQSRIQLFKTDEKQSLCHSYQHATVSGSYQVEVIGCRYSCHYVDVTRFRNFL